MHSVSLAKLRKVFGADAVLDVTIEEYGQEYQVLSSTTVVEARANLLDAKTGAILWKGKAVGREGSGGSGSLIADHRAGGREHRRQSTRAVTEGKSGDGLRQERRAAARPIQPWHCFRSAWSLVLA
jgi:hypothetical protein